MLKEGAPVGKDPVLELLGRVSALCNDSELRSEDGVWKVEGDPTEGALYPFGAKLGVKREDARAAYPRIDVIPFESEHKFMATLNKTPDGGEILLVKGAPEVILDHCDRQEDSAGDRPPLDRAYFDEAADVLASQGERVLALAWLPDPGLKAGSLGAADLPKNLVLLGLVGLLDPPRKEAIEAVKECHDGGIRVTMITGDHKITAAAIAKMLDIGDGKTAVTGAEVEQMDMATLQDTVAKVDVFARASPEHKLRLVKAIQANKQVVAMTGDGVNDAPALKMADIGVAMGIKGTEVTKEAAEMVLADDNFASISAAVKEGRTVYNNIEKAILFMLPTNVAQALVILAAIFVGFTMPITAPQILWVNMVTSVALGLVISFEPHELDVMKRPPRDGQSSDPRRLRRVARGLRRRALARSHSLGVLLDEGARGVGPARADGRGQHAGHRSGLLSVEQPVQDRLVAVAFCPSRQPLSANRHRRGDRDPAAPLHLRAAAAVRVRDRGDTARRLALAIPRRPDFLPRRRDREGDHPRYGFGAAGGRGGRPA